MRTQLFAFFLASALVFSASASMIGDELTNLAVDFSAIQQFVNGFADGLNYSTLSPDFAGCDTNAATLVNDIRTIGNVDFKNPDALAGIINTLAGDVANTVKNCGHAVLDIEDLVHALTTEIKTVNTAELLNNIVYNAPRLLGDITGLVSYFHNGQFYNLGQSLADVFVAVLYGNHTVQATFNTVRMLDEINVNTIITILNNAMMATEGFLSTANTTIAEADFENCVNNVALTGFDILPLETAIKSKDWEGAATAAANLLNQGVATAQACGTLGHEVVTFVHTVLPVFTNIQRLEAGLLGLFQHLGTTWGDIQNLIADVKSGDYQDAGVALGQIYNLLWTAMNA